MVYYFTSRCGEYTIYVGKDKYENEDLIKYGLPEDVWFHVDDLSSAHVYLRQKPGEKLDDITEDLLLDCSSLVKANSISGCKMNSVYVIYTRWKNLKKTNSMQDGAVSYHRPDNVRRMKVEKNKPIVNALNKTKIEDHPNLWQLQQDREREMVDEKKQAKKEQIVEERMKQKERNLAAQKTKEYHEELEKGIDAQIERTRMENLNLSDDDDSDSDESEGSFLGF